MQNTDFLTGAIKPIDCIKEGWETIKSDYWIMFAIAVVGGLIGGATLYILLGAMVCGIFYCYLRKIDGQPVQFDDLWKGFGWFAPGLIVTLVIVVPIIVVYGLIYAPFILAMIAGQSLGPEALMALIVGSLAFDLVLVLIMVCFHTLLMFSFPLIVDRGLSPGKAMTTSARAVWKNMGGVVGLILVNFGLTIAGELLFCVGLYLVIPILIAGNAVAYRKVFPRIPGV